MGVCGVCLLVVPGHRVPRTAPDFGGARGVCAVWAWWLFENCIEDASIFNCGQVSKGARWMPWHQEPMKDVGACDKPRGAGNQAVIRGCPNGETRLGSCPVTAT